MTVPIGTQLTEEQARVVLAPVDDSTIVIAPAGTGKTHTLVARAAHLIEHDDPRDGDVIVLSFSRAAAAEVRRRLRGQASMPYVAVWTFDAFATELLSRLQPDGAWQSLSYDDRIGEVTRLLAEEEARSLLENALRHVLVDEAQDLVGVRADFVRLLLEVTSAPFTVFADPTQAIYGFQTETASGTPLLDELQRLRGDHLRAKELALSQQHRATTSLVRQVMTVGGELTRSSSDDGDPANRIHLLADSMPDIPDLASARLVLRPTGRSTAVLCRSNAQALSASTQLRELGFSHTLRRRAEERAVGRWLAAVATSTATATLDRSSFDEAIARVGATSSRTPDEIWLALKRAEKGGARSIDLSRVAQMLLHNAIPDELNEPDDPHLVVSTIHRAKGLEFDTVIVVPGNEGSTDEREGEDEEARILYVALSRARESVYMLRGLKTHGLWSDRSIGRTVRAEYRGRWRQPIGVELLGGDTDATMPAGVGDRLGDPVEVQTYLLECDLRGEPVDLDRATSRGPAAGPPTYSVVHDGRTIGRTSESFGRQLQRLQRSLPGGEFPDRIVGAYVQMIDTVAGDVGVGRSAGVSRCGIWSRVRLEGVGDFVYDKVATR